MAKKLPIFPFVEEIIFGSIHPPKNSNPPISRHLKFFLREHINSRTHHAKLNVTQGPTSSSPFLRVLKCQNVNNWRKIINLQMIFIAYFPEVSNGFLRFPEPIFEEGFHHQLSCLLADCPFPDGHSLAHFAALPSEILVPDSGTSDPTLDSSNANTNSTATNQDGSILLFYLLGECLGKIWVMARLCIICSHVHYLN